MMHYALLLVIAIAAQLGRMPRIPPRPKALAVLPISIAMTVKTAAGESRASVAPGKAPVEPRAVAAVKPGEKPQIRWQVRNMHPKLPVRNVVIHFLVTRQEKAGEAVPASSRKGSVMDSVIGTDLSPKQAVSGSQNTALWEPGSYLVEVEILDPQGNRRHYCIAELLVGA